MRRYKPTKHPRDNTWTVRVTVEGQRYFLGYWPSEAMATKNAHEFRDYCERYKTMSSHEDREELATTVRKAAQAERDKFKAAKAKNPDASPGPRKTNGERIRVLEAGLTALQLQVQELRGQLR